MLPNLHERDRPAEYAIEPDGGRRRFLYKPMAILTVSGGSDGIGEPCA